MDNFYFPLDLSKLEDDRLRLVPFDSNFEELSATYVELSSETPEVFQYLPYGPFESQEAYDQWYSNRIRPTKESIIFAIILKAGIVRKRKPGSDQFEELKVEDGTFAGTTGLIRADPANSVVEVGNVVILPRFHRTFVGTAAHTLLLTHMLDPPPNGLHLRRVQWQAFSDNQASIAAAQRLGFQLEGIIRWQRVLPEGKKGNANGVIDDKMPGLDPTGQKKLGPGRHSAMLIAYHEIWKRSYNYHITLSIHTLGGHYKAIPPLSTTKQNKSNTRNTKSSKDHNRVNMSSKSFKSTTTLDNASTRTTSSTASTLKGMFTKSWKLKAPEKAPSSPKPSSKKAPAKDYTGEAVHHEAVAQYLALR
ncbi:hypothetical protein KXV28_005383 [Aspergillus fumigatus]|nr:hypothetical protein KXV28_005383 [Aspergillus fumigatus]KAH3064367.1 hypothetical protein KXW16_007689 [Aspergillus fumigatus]